MAAPVLKPLQREALDQPVAGVEEPQARPGDVVRIAPDADPEPRTR